MESSEVIKNLNIENEESILKFYFHFTLKDEKLDIFKFREENLKLMIKIVLDPHKIRINEEYLALCPFIY
jgi:hypothetical protein